jgi:uncharacterized protein (DUF58 family)
LRLFHEEVEPNVEILVDASRSMAVKDGTKHELARLLPEFFRHSARSVGCSSRVQLWGEELELVEPPNTVRFEARMSGLSALPMRVAQNVRRGSLACIVSDFLSEESPSRLLRAVSERASQLHVVMLLGPWEAAPHEGPMQRLIDSETGAELSTLLSREVLELYQTRLSRIRQELRDQCRRVGATFAEVICDRPLLATLKEDLLPAGMVVPT